ncbi:MAG: hypothetical protein IH892_20480, partial [Planctomycetes bacterium]|nr:hypothetical protein [Planctomycetota bacterium]
DYLTCLRGVYPHAGYVAVNISSPNTPALRELQSADPLDHLLRALKSEQGRLAQQDKRPQRQHQRGENRIGQPIRC